MKALTKTAALVLLPLAFALLSCSVLRPPKAPEGVHEDAAALHAKEVERKLQALLKQKQYRQVMAVVREERAAGAPAGAYVEYQVASLNGLLQSGLGKFDARDYGQAGLIFREVLENSPPEGPLQKGVRHSAEEMKSLIEVCSKKLMEQGLVRYREGNLNGAVALWRKILEFNPGYAEAERAISTTTIQIRNLRAIH
ncbi:MAG: hypothetical protein P8Y75_03370 [Nitrospirota bacterium]